MGVANDLHPPLRTVEQLGKGFGLRQAVEFVAKDVFWKVDHYRPGFELLYAFVILFFIIPHMGDIGPKKHHVAYVKALNAVSYDPFSVAFGNIYQVAFRVNMEGCIKMRITTLYNGDLVIGKSANFNEDGFHPFMLSFI